MLNIIRQAPLNHKCLAFLYACPMSIGARIRQLRLSNGLSGEKFGEMCDVTKGMVSQWESDTVTPSTDRLLALHKHLEFSFDWLLNGIKAYTTADPKIIAAAKAMEHTPEYVKDAAVRAVLSSCELAALAKGNGQGNGTEG